MPPIINGNATKMEIGTEDVFIEVTAIDEHKASIVLNMLVSNFATYTNFEIIPVKVINELTNETKIWPNINEIKFTCEIDYLLGLSGIRELPIDKITNSLSKMGMRVNNITDKTIDVVVPITRPDVLHPCDIAEDLAISYGYELLTRRLPPNTTSGKQLTLNFYSETLKTELVGLGFVEMITFGLTQVDEQAKYMKRSDHDLALVGNPKSIDTQCCRKSLIPGLLKTLHSNKSESLPINIFEVGDVVIYDNKLDIAVNQRYLCIATMATKSKFDEIHGCLDWICNCMEFDYKLETSNEELFIKNRGINILCNNEIVGVMGIIHPYTLNEFEIG